MFSSSEKQYLHECGHSVTLIHGNVQNNVPCSSRYAEVLDPFTFDMNLSRLYYFSLFCIDVSEKESEAG